MYITNPSGSPHLYFTSSFVAIRDLYPKSSVHCLLLPRDLRFSLRHPVEVLQSGSRDKRSGAETKDAKFFTELTAEAAKLKRLVASELERLYGRFSRSDRARQLALDGGDDQSGEGELPKGRDWEAEVVVGVHQRPSMAHLHVHVFSRDIGNSPSMKNAKHYNSFTTPFLVRLDEFPLAEDDARLVTGWNDGKASANADQHLKGDLVCWRCGRGFKRKFAELKKHLEEEFEEWKRE